jgi:hypothetical protein
MQALLTIAQACKFYCLSRPTLLDRIEQRLIRVKDLRRPGGKYRILRVIPDLQPDIAEEEVKELDIQRRLGL